MAKNKIIQDYLKKSEGRQDYKTGLNLYLEFSVDLKLKQKLIIGGETANNKSVLIAALKKLAKIDPKEIEKQKAKELEKIKVQKKLEKINELKVDVFTQIEYKNISAAKDLFEKLLKLCDCNDELEYIAKAIKGLEIEIEDAEKEINRLADTEKALKETQDDLDKELEKSKSIDNILKKQNLSEEDTIEALMELIKILDTQKEKAAKLDEVETELTVIKEELKKTKTALLKLENTKN